MPQDLTDALAPGRFEWNFRYLIFPIISVIDGWVISCELALRWMSLDLTVDKSTLVQVMAWCRQATSHYLSPCWPRSLSPYDITRPQGVMPRSHCHDWCGSLKSPTTILLCQISLQMMAEHVTRIRWFIYLFLFSRNKLIQIATVNSCDLEKKCDNSKVTHVELSQCKTEYNELRFTVIYRKAELLAMYNNAVQIRTNGLDVQQMHNEYQQIGMTYNG